MKRSLAIVFLALVLTLTLGGAALAAPLSLCDGGKVALYADIVSIGGRFGVTDEITVGAGFLGTDEGLVINGRWQATKSLLIAADYYLLPDTAGYDLLEAGIYFPLASGSNMVLIAGGGVDYYIVDGGGSSIELTGLAEVQFNISSEVVFYQNLAYSFNTDTNDFDFNGINLGLQYSF